MITRTVTVTADQRFNASNSNSVDDFIVVSKGDVLQIKNHGLFNKKEYIELPDICAPHRILLDSAIKDGWATENN